MELSPSPAPLPRAYDDRAVLLLEPMRDWFYARGLKKPRFSKTQEEEWVAGVAKDIQRNEIAVRPCHVFEFLKPPIQRTHIVFSQDRRC
jgi:hypothetical protein